MFEVITIEGIQYPNHSDAQRWYDQLQYLKIGLSYVKNFDLAIDGGAFVGAWTREMAKRFKKVVAFEPDPQNFELLKRNTKEFDNVFLHNAALGDQNTKIGLDGKVPCSRYIIPEGEIQMLRLDSLNLAPTFVKFDLEGTEIFALRGAEQTLKAYKPVVQMEYKDRVWDRYNSGDPERLLKSWGWKFQEKAHVDRIYTWT